MITFAIVDRSHSRQHSKYTIAQTYGCNYFDLNGLYDESISIAIKYHYQYISNSVHDVNVDDCRIRGFDNHQNASVNGIMVLQETAVGQLTFLKNLRSYIVCQQG